MKYYINIICLLFFIASCTVLVTKQDYQFYRTIELKTDPVEKAEAILKYEKHFATGGNWDKRVADIKATLENSIWNLDKNSKNLNLYLKLYPDGRYANQARWQLEQIKINKSNKTKVDVTAQKRAIKEWQDWEATTQREKFYFSSLIETWLKGVSVLKTEPATISEYFTTQPELTKIYPLLSCENIEEEMLTTCFWEKNIHYYIPVPGGTRVDKQASFKSELIYSTKTNEIKMISACFTGDGFDLPKVLSVFDSSADYYKSITYEFFKIKQSVQFFDSIQQGYIIQWDKAKMILKQDITPGCSGFSVFWN